MKNLQVSLPLEHWLAIRQALGFHRTTIIRVLSDRIGPMPATEELLSAIGACILAIDEQTSGDKQ